MPSLPVFMDGKDDIHSYLERFEHYVKAHKWDADKLGNNAKPPINITQEGVRRRLKGLNAHKVTGQDNLKPIVLKELADIIAPVVTRLYRASLKQAKTPDAWKEAHVTPMFKKGEKYKAINYRPVSLTCILCKQMEHILSSHKMEHLNTNHLLYDKQHGFRSKLSCETQLLEFTSDVLKAVQDKKQCDTVVMDFSKAFDKVSHDPPHLQTRPGWHRPTHQKLDKILPVW